MVNYNVKHFIDFNPLNRLVFLKILTTQYKIICFIPKVISNNLPYLLHITECYYIT